MKKFWIILLLLVLLAALAAPALTERAERGADLSDAAGELRERLGDKSGELLSWLKDYLASHESGEIAGHLRTIFSQTEALTDEELTEEIRAAAEGVSLHLSDEQLELARKLCRRYEKLDEEKLKESVEEWKERISSLGSLGEIAERFQDAGELFRDASQEASALYDRSKGLLDNLRDIVRGFAGTGSEP